MKRYYLSACLGILALSMALVCSSCNGEQSPSAESLVKEAHYLYQSLSEDSENREAVLAQVSEKLNQAIALAPEQYQWRVARVRFMWDTGDQLGAVKESAVLTQEFPQAPGVWDLEGDLRSELSQWNLADAAYEKAVALGGEELSIMLKLGRIKGMLSDFEGAFNSFDRAKELGAPKDVVYFNLGICYEGTENPVLAVDYYQRALTENPAYLPALTKMVEICQGVALPGYPDMEKAMEYAEKAYEVSPKDVKVLGDLADILVSKKDYDRALQIVEEALVLFPDNPDLSKFETYLKKLRDDQGP